MYVPIDCIALFVCIHMWTTQTAASPARQSTGYN